MERGVLDGRFRHTFATWEIKQDVRELDVQYLLGLASPDMVKLTPNVTDIVEIARAVVDAGADALCVINTLQAMAIDATTRAPVIGSTFSGLSGPAIKPVALRMVYQVASALDVPIIGCGGVKSGRDAAEFLLAGACAVQVGTATFANPSAPLEVLNGLQDYLAGQNVEDVREIVGAAQAAG